MALSTSLGHEIDKLVGPLAADVKARAQWSPFTQWLLQHSSSADAALLSIECMQRAAATRCAPWIAAHPNGFERAVRRMREMVLAAPWLRHARSVHGDAGAPAVLPAAAVPPPLCLLQRTASNFMSSPLAPDASDLHDRNSDVSSGRIRPGVHVLPSPAEGVGAAAADAAVQLTAHPADTRDAGVVSPHSVSVWRHWDLEERLAVATEARAAAEAGRVVAEHALAQLRRKAAALTVLLAHCQRELAAERRAHDAALTAASVARAQAATARLERSAAIREISAALVKRAAEASRVVAPR